MTDKEEKQQDEEKAAEESARTDLAPPQKDIPLHCKWTLWYDNPKMGPSGCDWKETLKHCGDFETVGGFWSIFNNLKPASQISANSNYSLFRHGIEPSWEDPSNVDGGKFVLTIPKKESRDGKGDEYWLLSVLAVIGETMDDTGDEVNGAVVSIRKGQDRVALWLKSAKKEVCVEIGARWKKVLNLDKTTLRFQIHKDALESGKTYRNQAQFQV